MFTEKEAERIADGYEVIYDAIYEKLKKRRHTNLQQDSRAAEKVASRIIAEKVGRGA